MMKNKTELLEQGGSLEKGFQLAYLITQDRGIAIDVLARAVEKLSVQCRQEKRRIYWRYNHSCQKIRRVTRQELDAFQWLIMFESESRERDQEQKASQSLRDMIVRYIKHLVQITTSMSSFYVCVGVNRLLYSYSTTETQAAFELVTTHFPGADQYRRAKKRLSSQLSERFGEFIEIVGTRHGELRFKTLEDQDRWQDLVEECLSMFSPWSTDGWCEHFDPKRDVKQGSCLAGGGGGPAEPDAQETIYCHMFIEPVCRRNLLAALSLSSPEARLALPSFAMKEDKDGDGGRDVQLRRAPKLTAEETALIAGRVNAAYARRQNSRPGFLVVVVDGQEQARFDLSVPCRLQIELREGAKLIEIRGEDEDGELLLGTQLISHADGVFEFSKSLLSFSNGRARLTVSPLQRFAEEASATLTVTFRRRFRMSWSYLARVWRSIRSTSEEARCRCYFPVAEPSNAVHKKSDRATHLHSRLV
ncbi:MAG: hypothetical protein ABSG51_03440 [Terracidiphilus sp.]